MCIPSCSHGPKSAIYKATITIDGQVQSFSVKAASPEAALRAAEEKFREALLDEQVGDLVVETPDGTKYGY